MSKCIVCIINIFRTNENVKQNHFLLFEVLVNISNEWPLNFFFNICCFYIFDYIIIIITIIIKFILTHTIYQKYQNCGCQMLPFLLLLKSRCILKDEYMYIPFSLEQTSKQLNPNVYTFTYIENIRSVYTSVY